MGLIAFIAIPVWYYYKKQGEEKLLEKYGEQTNAITISTQWRKRGTEVKYFYVVKNKRYEDWTKVPIQNGERIDIVVPNGIYALTYYPGNPEIHRIDLNHLIKEE